MRGSSKPFLKWIGGKRTMASDLLARVPVGYNKYCEPFVGGGALFYALQPDAGYSATLFGKPTAAHLSDVNADLITAYTVVRDNIDELVDELKRHTKNHCFAHFQESRIAFADKSNPVKFAGHFIYLNKTCYRSKFEINKKGHFSSSMDTNLDGEILNERNLRNSSIALQGVQIECRSFFDIVPEPGVFYYLDPPYYKTAQLYNVGDFGKESQAAVAKKCRDIDKAGGYFMASNSAEDYIRELYAGFNIEKINVHRVFAQENTGKFGTQEELLIRNYGENENMEVRHERKKNENGDIIRQRQIYKKSTSRT